MDKNTAVLTQNKDSALTSIEIGRTTGTALASCYAPHIASPNYSWLQRQAKTHLLMGSSCGIWLSYIVLSEQVTQAIAWVFLLGGLMLSSLSRWLSVRHELIFCLESRFQPDFPDLNRSTAPKGTNDRELEELAAPIIALISIAVPLALLAIYLIFHVDFAQLHKPVIQRQVVEIELVAPSDAVDRKDILPSTNIEIASKARKGALYTVASQALVGAAIPRSKPSTKADNSDKIRAEDKSIAHSQITTTKKAAIESKATTSSITKAEQKASSQSLPLTFKAPDNWKTIVVAKEKDNSIAFSTYSKAMATQTNQSPKSQAFLSEVEPANMIESIDSEGQLSPLTTQVGGRSSSGNGAQSTLHSYLKLLNRKVKSHWLPPRGIDRIAIIEFRISADGKLLLAKALSHSGNTDAEAEAAAISAINKSFPFQPLPAEVKASNLDVRFTFNYHFKQIEEVSSNQ